MAPTTDALSRGQARRIALAAQGFTDPRPSGRVDRRHLRRVMQRVGLVQIDSVNVLTRSHELPFLARLGPYDRAALSRWLWGSGEVFEYWGHEASLLPVELHPLLRWRMHREEGHAWNGVASFLRTHPRLHHDVLEAVRERGPVTLGELDHLGDVVRRTPAEPGQMWNWTPAKKAMEWLFWRGEVAAIRNPITFERRYLRPEAVLPAEVLQRPPPAEDDAQRELLLLAARSHGVGSARCLADYLRLNVPRARTLLAGLAADGALRAVEVEGWQEPLYLHPDAVLPRRVAATALLSPFDSLVWERRRVERLFEFRYRLEIYVPEPKRVHGYYVLPFLQDDRLTARLDLKADRAAGVLRVQAAHAEPPPTEPDPVRLAAALAELATFLGLGAVAVAPRGDLADRLARAVG